MRAGQWVQVRQAYVITGIVILCYIALARFEWGGEGLTSLIRFGDRWESTRIPELIGVTYHRWQNHTGYDGQFYAQIAVSMNLLDPELREAVDVLSYRARRIAMPAVAHVLGWGAPQAVLHVYSVLNLLAWLGCALVLLRWLPPVSWENYARWTGILLSSGALESIRASLTELPMLFLLLLGMRCWEQGRGAAGTLVLAAGGLTRETAVLGLGFLTTRLGWWRGGVVAGVAALPIALWVLWLKGQFPQDAAGFNNFALPFVTAVQGVMESVSKLGEGIEDNGRYTFRLLAVLALAVQWGMVLGMAIKRRDSVWARMAWGYLLLLPVLGAPVWDGYWAVTRTVLPLTAAFFLLLPSGRWFWWLVAIASLPSLHALFRIAF